MEDELDEPSEQQSDPEHVEERETELAFALDLADGAGIPASTVIGDGIEASDREPALPFPVVGIGASAGGVEAYIELFKHLPTTTGMAFVVVPHLSAGQTSYMREIIGSHTRMPIAVIETGVRPEPDHVYLLPPNALVCLRDGALQLLTRTNDDSFHPIDFFFRSLAAGQKNFGIGVVLSGMDSDGALGLKAIKGEAGIVVVQSPESARFPEMPRSSISAGHVDMILPPDQIAQQLGELGIRFRNPRLRRVEAETAPPEEEKYFRLVLKLLKGVSGVDFRLYKPTTVRRRMMRRMLMHHVDSLAEYASILKANSNELRDLQEDILINVTRFFRDPEFYEAIKNVVFPQLFVNRSPDQQVRIWVAGCSSGEEAYSLAMCILEYVAGNALEPPIQIFGTDASEISIQVARAGAYPDTITNEVSPERLRRFFTKAEKGYMISKRVRDLCIFARQNLCNDPPFSRLDLISCRNVLIYFDSQLQRHLVRTLHYALRPDGFLLLGNSETIREFADLFSLTDRKHKIYSKVDATPSRALMEIGPRVYLPDLSPEAAKLVPAESWSDVEIQRAADRIVLSRFGPPGIVVNEKLEILQSRGHTSPFLELAPGAASLQLARMTRESLAPHVITAVKRALKQNLPVQIERLRVRDGDEVHQIRLEVLPMHHTDSRSKCYLVLFVPTSPAWPAPLDKTPDVKLLPEVHENDTERVIAELQQDLSSTRLYLQSLLEERDARNQELISANEEVQSANEELQSTNEELETAKEELQSSNEELQTVNDELRNRNTVLTQASNDLSNLLNSVNLPVLMLSRDLNIRHFTPQTQRLMSVRTGDIGRPFSDFRLSLNIDNPEALFAEVLETLVAREIEVQDREGHWYLLRVRPYRTTDDKIDGLVIALVDIDQLRRSQQELREARDFARSIIETIPLPLVVIDSNLKIHSTNEAFCALTGSFGQAGDRLYLPDLAALLWGMGQLGPLLEGLRDENVDRGTFEFEHPTPNENPRILRVRGRALQPRGAQQFLLVTFEDITAQKEVEHLLTIEGKRLASEVRSTATELVRSKHELRGLTDNLFTSQEDERRHLARELHDDISQRLAAINIQGDQVLRTITADPSAARQKLEKILAQVGQLSEDVRILSHGLHPSMIEDLGLAAALRSLTDEFGEREEMIATFFSQDVPEKLPADLSTGLYRIAQEALRNVAKHAGKTHVKVRLIGIRGGVELQITDSGKGFDVEQNHSGLGLISMKERVRLAGGTFDITSALREGTKVTVYVPLRAEA